MTREVAHQKSFEKKALYSIQPNFPPGKAPADPAYSDLYFKMSQGAEPELGPWNQGNGLELVLDPQPAVDGGSGGATVELPKDQIANLKALARRTMSDPDIDPVTGAELGQTPQPE